MSNQVTVTALVHVCFDLFSICGNNIYHRTLLSVLHQHLSICRHVCLSSSNGPKVSSQRRTMTMQRRMVEKKEDEDELSVAVIDTGMATVKVS